MKKSNKKHETNTANEDNEISLFRDSMRDVTPLAASDKVVHTREDTRPIPKKIQEDEQPLPENSLSDYLSLEIAAGDEWSFLRPGLSRQTLRRMRRGYWGIQAHLDLHGFTRDEARSELAAFLDASSNRNFRCVCVIHGRGLGSKNREPILKIRVGNWLVQRNDVLAFCQARPEDGGSGAVLVLLKASDKQKNKSSHVLY